MSTTDVKRFSPQKTHFYEYRLTSVFGYLNITILTISILIFGLFICRQTIENTSEDVDLLKNDILSQINNDQIGHVADDTFKIKELSMENWVNIKAVKEAVNSLEKGAKGAADDPLDCKNLLIRLDKVDNKMSQLEILSQERFNKLQNKFDLIFKNLNDKKWILVAVDNL